MVYHLRLPRFDKTRWWSGSKENRQRAPLFGEVTGIDDKPADSRIQNLEGMAIQTPLQDHVVGTQENESGRRDRCELIECGVFHPCRQPTFGTYGGESGDVGAPAPCRAQGDQVVEGAIDPMLVEDHLQGGRSAIDGGPLEDDPTVVEELTSPQGGSQRASRADLGASREGGAEEEDRNQDRNAEQHSGSPSCRVLLKTGSTSLQNEQICKIRHAKGS